LSRELSLSEKRIWIILNPTNCSTIATVIKKNGLDAFIELISILLTETNQTISEIAVRCGFYNISNFNRIFKKNIGCTPANTARIFRNKTG